MQPSKRCSLACDRCNEMEANGQIQEIFRQHVVINVRAIYCREIKKQCFDIWPGKENRWASFHWGVWKLAFICWLVGGFKLVLTEKRDLK